MLRNVSLKWLIFSFYLLFGYLPLLALSYLTISASTQSLEKGTQRNMTVLLNAVTDRMEARYKRLETDLRILADLAPVVAYVQSSGDGSVPPPVQTIRHFLGRDEYYLGAALYSAQGALITAQSLDASGSIFPQRLSESFARGGFRLAPSNNGAPRELAVIAPVMYDGLNERVTGMIFLATSLDGFINPLHRADLGEQVVKTILDAQGGLIWEQAPLTPPAQTVLQKPRDYESRVPGLGWTLRVMFPETVIFGGVYRQLIDNLLFIGIVALVAAMAGFEFSRRISNHISRILEGAHRFAAGDLDYRITVDYGKETRELAEEFNRMAERLKGRQAELIRNNRLACLGLFSAEIAHELKNPLAGMKTSAQALRGLVEAAVETDDSTDDRLVLTGDDLQGVLTLSRGVSAETDRLNRILTGLLDFARPRPSRMKSCNISETARLSLQAVRGEITKKGVQIVNRIEELDVVVDPDQLVQILINLLLNGLNAVPAEGGIITLETDRDGEGRLVLSVADNGDGIDEENLERVFEPFFTSRSEGHGLGLSAAYALALQNNMLIEVRGRKGEGAVFSLVFSTLNESMPEAAKRA